MGEPTDAELVAAARGGDRAAFARLVERHYALLLASCRRALGDPAADVAQEAVMQALLGLEGLRRPESFGAWLVGIGLNLSRRALDRRSVPLSVVGDRPSDGPGPAELAESALAAARVRQAIAALPPGQRDAVTLFYLAGFSGVEVADRLASSPGAVKTRLHKARATLRAQLSDLREETMTRMRIADVRDTRTGTLRDSHVVVLQEEDGPRRLPIWIGAAEGAALAMRLGDVELPRPGTYELTGELLRAAGTSVSEVRIVRLTDMVFYAQVVLAGCAVVDARPSDALNLALLTGAPVLVEESVLERAAATEDRMAGELASALASPRDAGVLAEEARALLAEQRRRLDELRA